MEAFPVEAGWVNHLLRSGGLAKSTSSKYISAFLSFVQWYSVYGFVVMGGLSMEWSDESVWLLWLGWMSQFRAYSTIRSSIFGIKHHFELRFGFNPFKSNCQGHTVNLVRFRRALRQVKRDSVSKGKLDKFSLTKFVMLKLYNLFDFGDFDDVLVWAIMSLGVTCLLRWSEVTLVNSDYDKLLKHTDLVTWGDEGILHLRDTKTKLFGDSMSVNLVRDKSKTCAMDSLDEWFACKPKSKWLFCHRDGSPVKATWVQAIIKKKLQLIGCCKDSGPISLRKGGALTLASCGVPDRVIQVIGRWKSDAYRVYIDITLEEKAHWHAVVVDKLEKGEPSCSVSSADMERKKMSC